MRETVLHFIKTHQLMTPGVKILVGVSGGPDSMALLHLLKSISEEQNLKVLALCINHQLRGDEARKEFEYVEAMCHKWEIPFIGQSIDVDTYKDKHNVSTQMAARKLRYIYYEKYAGEVGAQYIALGHHADDQIETMFMSLSQIARSSAFSGIPIRRKLGTAYIIRPLLAVTRNDILSYCDKYKINPKFDPSNEDEQYMRSYYRKNIIPTIKARHQNISKTIQYLSETIEEDEDYLINEAKKAFQNELLLKKDKDKIIVMINEFNPLPGALQRRVYQLILDYLYNDLPSSLSYVHEQTFLSFLDEDKGNAYVNFPYNLRVEKVYDEIHIYFKEEIEPQTFYEQIDVPAVVELPDGATIQATFTDEYESTDDLNTYICPVDSLSLPLHIRTRRPGDRMTWRGLNGSKKIKDIFIDEKLPRIERDRTYLIADADNTVLWLIGVKKGNPQKQQVHTHQTRYIKIVYRP